MAKRIGPKMAWAARIVAANHGCNICFVADQVGPNGSRRFGYAIVHRAIDAGLIIASRMEDGTYRLQAPAC